MFKVLEILYRTIKPIRLTVWPAVITAAGAIGSQIIGGSQRRRQYGKQRQFNKQMAEYEWKKNLEMWHKQNQYNSPTAQMKRFKDAGLNPNLIYGQGTPGNASMMPNFTRPEMPVDTEPVVKPIEAILNGIAIKMQQAKTKQEQEKAKQEGINTFVQEALKLDNIRSVKLDNIGKAIQNKIEESKQTYWKDGINPNDMIWFRFLAITAKEAAKLVGDNWENWKSRIKGYLEGLTPKIQAQIMQFFSNPLPWMR